MDEKGFFSDTYSKTIFRKKKRQFFSFSLFHPILLERRRRRGAVLYLKKEKEHALKIIALSEDGLYLWDAFDVCERSQPSGAAEAVRQVLVILK